MANQVEGNWADDMSAGMRDIAATGGGSSAGIVTFACSKRQNRKEQAPLQHAPSRIHFTGMEGSVRIFAGFRVTREVAAAVIRGNRG